jgi:hypothetical protein
MMWFANDVVVWFHIVMLAAAFTILSGPESRPLRRAGRALLIGATTSIALVTIALAVGWITDDRHFFHDGGPLALMIVIEVYVGVPAALLGAVWPGSPAP